MNNKLYVVRTKVEGETFYLKFLNAGGTFAEYTKNLEDAEKHTKEEMEYVKKWHLPGLGRWVLLDSERSKI